MVTHVLLDAVLIWYKAGYFEANFFSLPVSWPPLPHSFCQFPQVTGFLDFLQAGFRGKEWAEVAWDSGFIFPKGQEHRRPYRFYQREEKEERSVYAKGKDLEKLEEAVLSQSAPMPRNAGETERIMDSRSRQCACCFWQCPLRQQNPGEEWLHSGWRLTLPQEVP